MKMTKKYLHDYDNVQWIDDYHEGLAWFGVYNDSKDGMGHLSGVIDKNQRVVIEPAFSKLSSYSEGMAGYYNGARWGFIDTHGCIKIQAEYYDITDGFKQGLCACRNAKESKYGYINKKGIYVIPPIYDFAFPFSYGRAKVVLDGNFYFIDKRGRLLTKALHRFRGV